MQDRSKSKARRVSPKKAAATFKVAAKKILDRLKADRDELRLLVEDYENILNSTDEGIDYFEAAIDTLSETF